jgi:hypothetical protein
MTEPEDTSEQSGDNELAALRSMHLKHWMLEVRSANQKCRSALEDAGATEDELRVVDVSRWLCSLLNLYAQNSGFHPSARMVERLRAIEGLTHSDVYGDTTGEVIVRALRLVEFSLGRHAAGREAEQWNLIIQLEHVIHPRFAELRSKAEAVAGLLERYEPDPQRRKRGKGMPQGLGSTGILAALNELAGRPLGQGELSASAISNAVERFEANRITHE